jgi:hypothetical protein
MLSRAGYDPGMSPVILAIGLVIAGLVLIPTRRLQLGGWSRDALTTYFVVVWLLGVTVALIPAPTRFLLPVLLIAYLAPFVTLRAGLARLLGRPVRRPPAEPDRPPIKNVTPPDADGRA